MNLWTSSFSRAGRLPGAVSISVGKPRGFAGRTFDLLAPRWIWVQNYQRGVWDWQEYSAVHNSMLAELDAVNVVAALGENATMCCFCDVSKFPCHRQLVSLWLLRQSNLIVPELTVAGQLSFDFAG